MSNFQYILTLSSPSETLSFLPGAAGNGLSFVSLAGFVAGIWESRIWQGDICEILSGIFYEPSTAQSKESQ